MPRRTYRKFAPRLISWLSKVGSAALILGLVGCASLQFYGQAIYGHFELQAARRPLSVVLNDPTTSPALRRKLSIAQAARQFASAGLGLPENGYRHYSDLGRPFVVWNVFAAPALSLELQHSCFLVVGCLDYRGYFSAAAAEGYARLLRTRGYDVFVGGVAAYSTLGWFNDPVLNTMVRWSDAVLVKTIFHELAHQQVYLNGDSTFNESFATAIAEYGLKRWQAEDPIARDIVDDTVHDREFVALLQRYRAALERLYASTATIAEKTARKTEILNALTRDYQQRKAQWGKVARYDAWMSSDLNNAKLGSIATYHDYVDAFTALLRCENENLFRFYAVVRELTKLSPTARQAKLRAADETCAAP
ncbi:MAG: aminopeptidase [Gammaproteobacteria bacterium]